MKFELTQVTQVWVQYFKSFGRVKSTQDEKMRFFSGNELLLFFHFKSAEISTFKHSNNSTVILFSLCWKVFHNLSEVQDFSFLLSLYVSPNILSYLLNRELLNLWHLSFIIIVLSKCFEFLQQCLMTRRIPLFFQALTIKKFFLKVSLLHKI